MIGIAAVLDWRITSANIWAQLFCDDIRDVCFLVRILLALAVIHGYQTEYWRYSWEIIPYNMCMNYILLIFFYGMGNTNLEYFKLEHLWTVASIVHFSTICPRKRQFHVALTSCANHWLRLRRANPHCCTVSEVRFHQHDHKFIHSTEHNTVHIEHRQHYLNMLKCTRTNKRFLHTFELAATLQC